MALYVHQSIHINVLRVGNIINSSLLQIGTSGIIHSSAQLANTGMFAAPIPEAKHPGYVSKEIETTSVPLQPSG
ncbi:MAG: spore gernimation protein KA [Caldibacillus debilis]|uniref:Spore gernimation protein KA n=1 Tax=Caldibacillus debilis TaxID=301148 RepID=A0A3E0K494_9BACI|nr:spore germination protein GerPB [Caldibacillus debilis]REJ28154.1 MAG: spore gernimation protein KA [Caldibacillus debilis]